MMLDNNYSIWVEIEANKKRILNRIYFEEIMDKCVYAGIGSIILAVKDTSGFGIYDSKVVPHYSKFDEDFEDRDYLKEYIEMAHKKGLKLYAGIDVFAEGRVKEKNILSPGFKNPSWQSHMYGVNKEFEPTIRPISDLQDIKSTGSIDDFNEVFVNPIMDEVRQYEVSIVKELTCNYDIDGVVLDRVRFVGLGSDFSDYTRSKFEKFLNANIANWPEDIYSFSQNAGEMKIEYGPLFGEWITFRATYIKKFIMEISDVIKSSGKNIEFVDYTGSWYPLYYLVGANWARNGYVPEEYPWVNEKYGKTGYAEYLDKLLSGFYYEDVTIAEALNNKKPEYWYSVEGSGDMLNKVVGNAVPFIGSLFVRQYEGDAKKFKSAIDMCFKKSEGCMIFDLCYIDDYDWWSECKREW